MATTAQVLTDGFSRVQDEVHAVLSGASSELLVHRPDGAANSIAWLVWHLARIQDDHVAAAGGFPQRWTEGEWSRRFGLPFSPEATGYGQGPAEVAQVRCAPGLLGGYYDDVHGVTVAYLAGLTDTDLDQVVDRRWNPPVTLGVRLVSVLSDDLQHVGQAAYVRGLAERAGLVV
jgi:hypothetical protein